MKTLRVLLLSVLVLVLACSDDSTTGPEGDGSYVLEATETVGAAGDTFAIEDFSLVVPPGAFDGEHTLKVYASSEDKPFDQNQVTRSFRLEGLPAEYDQPLRVSIKYGGVLSGETYLAQGERAFDYVRRDSITAYRPHAAMDSSGCLVAEVPVTQPGAARLPAGMLMPSDAADAIADAITFIGVQGYSTYSTEHFSIRYPVDLVINMIPVGETLEQQYHRIMTELGFTWPWTHPRVQVFVMDLEGDHVADHGGGMYWDVPVLDVSRGHLSQGMLITVGHEVGLRVLWAITVSRDMARFDPDHIWFRDAAIRWYQWQYGENSGNSPIDFPSREMAPFQGMRAGAGSTISQASSHGAGMSSVVKFLVGDPRFTPAGLGTTYARIFEGSGATPALLRTMNALVAEWWPQFFKSYVGGGIYGVGKEVFTASANLSGSWAIAAAADTVHTFTGSYPDLSAKLYMLNLNYATIDESADLELTLGGQTGYHEPWGVMAFGVGATSLEYWGHSIAQGSTSLRIDGLRNLYDSGWRQILVVAICSNPSDTYLQTTDADLEVRVTEEQEPMGLTYNRCRVNLNELRGYYWADYFDPSGEDRLEMQVMSLYFQTAEGSFVGGTFSGSYDFTDSHEWHYTGTVTARLVGQPASRLAELQISEHVVNPYGTQSTRLRVEDVELEYGPSWTGWLTAETWGEVTCDHITDLADTMATSTCVRTLQSWDCEWEQSAHLKVFFYTE